MSTQCCTLTPYQTICLSDTCGDEYWRECESMDICKCARRWRKKLLQKLMVEAMKPGGEIIQLGNMRKARWEYTKALQGLIDWTYLLCRRAAQEAGPMLIHNAPEPCSAEQCAREVNVSECCTRVWNAVN